ncbi:MAG: hypothetical protein F6K48_05520 [Okeania sp. SIO3H1]|nr:hypothetical protein [Okeania sp. SIO3H1]
MTPYPITFPGQITESFIQKERAKISWAKNWEQEKRKFLSQIEELNQAHSSLQAQKDKIEERLENSHHKCSQLQSIELLDYYLPIRQVYPQFL